MIRTLRGTAGKTLIKAGVKSLLAVNLLLFSAPAFAIDADMEIILNRDQYHVISPFCINIADDQYKQNISMEHEEIYNVCMAQHGFEKEELTRLKPHYLKFMHKGGG